MKKTDAVQKKMLIFFKWKQIHVETCRSFNSRALAAILFASCTASACSPATLASANAPTPTQTAPAAMTPSYGQAVRVIVTFRREVPYRNVAFLQDIGRQTRARISYLSSVSVDTHVYQVEPQAGRSQADVLQSFSSISSVLRVELDALARPS